MHQLILTYFLLISLLVILTHQLGYDDLTMTYSEFKVKFDKVQLTADQEFQREKIFYSNLKTLKSKLDGGCQYCAVTKFFDQNLQSFTSTSFYLSILDGRGLLLQLNQTTPQIVSDSFTPKQITSNSQSVNLNDVPTSLNWASKGKVTSVKNQGNCGTCWSFATVGAIQSSLILKGQATKNFFYEPDLSQEFLLTCAQGTCSGGYLQEAIDLAYDKGVPYESANPYQGKKGDPSMCSNTRRNIKYTDGNIARYSFYEVGDTQIINMLQTGPIMVAVSADNWEYYGGGTFSCTANAQVNHAVLLVGYDSDKWIIKNQWGTNWGQKGYISITRNPLYNCRIGASVHQLSETFLFFSIFLLFFSLILIH